MSFSIRQVFFVAPVAMAVSLVAACTGTNADIGGGGDAGSNLTTPDGSCNTDAECPLPETTPANCAAARCDLLQHVCLYAARDKDGDGHASARCTSTNGAVIISTGDDCDDADADLYPGRPKACSANADGSEITWPTGTAVGACRYGEIVCSPDGNKSGCRNAVPPATLDCNSPYDNDCDGRPDKDQCACLPGDTQCDGNSVQTCDSKGTWGVGAPCTSQACVAGACQGACAPGLTQCAGNKVQTCSPQGEWDAGTECVGSACVGGECAGSCAPAQKRCSGSTTVQTCSAGGTWQPATSCVSQACVNGACQGNCTPGARQCAGANGQPQLCNSSGQWANDGASCTAQGKACSNGSCTGECAPGTVGKCNAGACNERPNTCTNDGKWPGCPNAKRPQWNGQNLGAICVRGRGACLRLGQVVCQGEDYATCTADTIAPVSDSDYRDYIAPNGSWDWNCNGTTDYMPFEAVGSDPTALCRTMNGNPDACLRNMTDNVGVHFVRSAANPYSACGGAVILQQCWYHWGSRECRIGATDWDNYKLKCN